MMVSSPAAGDPYAAAAALDRTLRSNGADGGGADSAAADGAPPDGGPDVVVTLSQGGAPPPATYGPSGRMGGPATPADMGANGPGSLATATESDGDDDASAPSDATADADADTAVAA